MNDFVVMGAPVDCVGRPGGNELAPMVLRQCGVIDAIKPKLDLNDLSVRIQGEDRDPESGLKGAASVVTMTAEVRRAVAAQMAQGNKPVILGGCCSYVMGAVSAARDVIGRVGLVYIDGHLDLYDGSTSPSGECADMPLAIMLGRGPRILDESMGKHPPTTRCLGA